MTMIPGTFPRLRRAVTLVAAAALLIGIGVAVAPEAAASDDVCTAADRYLLLVDPTGVANQALCHVQEDTLKRLSENQWGQEYTADQRARMLSWGRSDALGAMYVELLSIASKKPDQRSADEATMYAWLQTTLAALRQQMAQSAYNEQIAYSNDPCGYTPPTPGASTIQCGNSDSLMTLFGPPPGPTYEQFVGYGAQRALGQFGTSDLAMIGATARAARDQLIGAAVGGVAGIGIGVGLVAAATAGMAYTAMLGAITTSTVAATAAVSALGAFVVAAGASVLFVALAATLAVVRGVQVIEEAQIPDKLRADIDAAKQPVDIESWVGTDSSRATLLLQSIARRINTTPAPLPTPPSGASAASPGFLVTSGVDDTTFTRELRFRSPVDPDAFFTAWLDHGWWVIKDDTGALAMTHSLVSVDHDGRSRSASWMAGIRDGVDGDTGSGTTPEDGFLVTTIGVSDAGTDDSGTACDSANGCETTDALEIVTGPLPGAQGVARNITATLHTSDITFTSLPDDIAASYEVGDEIHAHVSASADYLTTMAYRWQLTRHDETGDKTITVEDSSLDATLAFPGEYRLQVTATAASGESATHTWDFTVTGEAGGQSYSGILLTQYSQADATPEDTPGEWREGTTEGTICLQTGSTDPTDFAIQFDGEDEQTVPGVTAGYACFPRPASADKSGTHPLAKVSACATSGSLCWPTSMLNYENGLWVQTSPFSYTVANEPPFATDIQQGLAGDTLSAAVPSTPSHFTVGDIVEAKTTVSDAGGGPLTVHIRWSDGTGETRTDVPSGTTVDVTHTYSSVAWGPVGVQIQAVDDTGEAGNLATGWFVVQPRPASLTLETEVGTGGLVTVTGQITDPDRTASVIGIDWGDGSSDGSGDGTGYRYDAPFPAPPGTEATTADVGGRFQVTHHYATGGDHTINAVLWNGADDYATASTTVTLPNTAPAVVSDEPITVIGKDTVSLSALIGDLNADDTLTLSTVFDDGATSLDPDHSPGDTVTLTHQFAGDGQHTITLTVTDGSGATSQITRCFVLTDGIVTPCADTIPASGDDVRSGTAGSVDAPGSAERGAWITISLGADEAGQTVTIYLYSTPTLLGTVTADANGKVSVRMPTAVPAGSHTLAVFAGAALVGWAPITVPPAGGSGVVSGSESGSGGETGTTDDATPDSGAAGTGPGSAVGSGPGSNSGDVHHAAGGDIADGPADIAPESAALAATGVRTRDLLGLALLLLAAGASLTSATRRLRE